MKAIEQLLQQQVSSGKTPSVQYYFFDTENVLFQFSSGYADIQQGRKVSAGTTYNAYSITKTFTALAVLQLAEKGLLNIDSPFINYLPLFPYGKEVTIRQVLAHTAGIPNPIPLKWIHLASEHSAFNGNQYFKEVFAANNKVKSKPNQKFAYTNLGYVLLGQLIESCTGKKYEEHITENIIRQLNLPPGELDFEVTDLQRQAKGYQKRFSFIHLLLGFLIDKDTFMDSPEGKWKPFKLNYVNGAAYGGLIGTPRAFVRYIQELLKTDSPLLSPAYKQQLFTENKDSGNHHTGMCLSWFTGKLNGVEYFSHAGGGGGYYCELRIYPSLQKGSVIFFNRTGISDERFLNKTDRYFLL